MFIFIKLLFPLELKAICQNAFTDYRKEYFKCNLRMLDMEEIFIVMLDLCSCYKHELQHRTDQGAHPGCAACWPQGLPLLAEMLNILSLLHKTEVTPAPHGCCQVHEDAYVIHLPQDLACDKCSKYESWSQLSPTSSDKEILSQQFQWVIKK